MKNFRFLIVNIYILFLITNVSFSQNTLFDQAKTLLDSTTPGETIKFAVLSDSHWHYNDPKSKDMMIAILNSAKVNGANLIFICGDSYNHASDMELGFYEALNSEEGWMYLKGIPIFLVPGNHDFQEDWTPCERQIEYRQKINPFWDSSFVGLGADIAWDYHIDYDFCKFIITNNVFHPDTIGYLDSIRHVDSLYNQDSLRWVYDTTYTDTTKYLCRTRTFNVTDAQLDTIEAQLNDATIENKFGFVHCPLFETSSPFGKETIKPYDFAMRNMFKNYGGKAIFSGHTHKYFRYKEPNGYQEIIVGPSGMNVFWDSLYKCPPSVNSRANWILVTVTEQGGLEDPDDIDIEVFEVDTFLFQSVQLPQYSFNMPLERELNKYPTQQSYLINNEEVQINSDMPDFSIKHMVFGWHWGGDSTLTKAMNMNQKHTSSELNSTSLPDSAYIIKNPDGVWASGNEANNPMQAMAIEYEPILKIVNPGEFNVTENDKRNPVFGFKYIHDDVKFTDSTAVLYKDSIANNSLILKNIWPNNLRDGTIGNIPTGDTVSNTTRFYIDIEMKRHNLVDSLINDSELLKIKIKRYYSNGTSKYLKFSKVPKSSFIEYYEEYSDLGEFRSKVRRMSDYETEDMIIKNKMLPLNSEPIIISAYIITDGDSPDTAHYNDQLTSGSGDSLDIEITYCNNNDIEIDWIRLETPNGRKLIFGKYDSLIKAQTQSDLTYYTEFSNPISALRFYTRDEIGPRFWLACRYFNKLVGNIGITKDEGDLDSLFRYYVGTNERWIEFGSNGYRVANPFMRKSDSCKWKDDAFTYGLGAGYEGIDSNIFCSGYETFVCRNGVSTNYTMEFLKYTTDIDEYRKKLENAYVKSSFQGYFEKKTWEKFVKQNFLYSGKIWWAQYLLGSNFTVKKAYTKNEIQPLDSILYIRAGDFNRQKTGEEMRAFCMSSLLKGAKGLIFDRDKSYTSIDYVTNGERRAWSGLMDYNTEDFISDLPSNDIIIYSDTIGGDFLKDNNPNGMDNTDFIYINDTTFKYNDTLAQYDNILMDTLAKYMNVSRDRIYLGEKSTRVELKHIIDYCRANENTLWNLELQAWFGKGYKTWYNQHGDYNSNDSILKKFVSLDSADWILHRTAVYDSTLFLTYEPWDSAFFDITLLKDKRQSMDTVYYIGIQNRRTDPLILYPGLDVEPAIENNYIRFLSTAEFYDSCNALKNPGSYERMRELYWKRLGCREITIPFDFLNTINTQNKCMLQITELGGDLYLQDSIKWFWKAPIFNKLIDTVIWHDKDLVVRLLPGEGKFLKVTVLRGDNNISGYLEHSNQTKIVAHPVLDGVRETDSIRYHAVYFKKYCDSCVNSPIGVYYRRSSILDGGCSSNELINWEPEIYLSHDINQFCINPLIPNIDTLSCDHPSIVVRKKDDNTLNAYVVYDCQPKYTTSIVGYIVESVLEVNNITPSVISTHAIGSYHGSDNDSSEMKIEWGTPVINASANGNYYAWSDSIKVDQFNPNDFEGIVIGYRSLNSQNYCLEDSAISWNSGKPRHPSVNPYSLIEEGENECALVWQEEFDNNNNIFCTRLKYDTNNSIITHYFPKNRSNSSTYLTFNQDSSIVLIDGNNDNTYPVIYRSLDFLNYYSIYWQSDPEKVGWNMRIGTEQIFFKDNGQTEIYNARIPYSIWSPIYSLTQPNVSQGFDDSLSQGEHIYYHMLGFRNLNNIYEVGRVPQMISFDNAFSKKSLDKLWQVSDISEGFQPHLVSNKDYLSSNEKWKNRRIFNTENQDTVNIETSNRALYRRSDNNVSFEGYAGFTSNTFYYYIGYATLDDEDLSWNLPYHIVVDSLNRKYYEPYNGDSIYTDYFNVAPMTTAELDFTVYGFNNTSTTIGLEGHPSNTFTRLPIPLSTSDTTATFLQFTFINMSDCEYRVIFINYDTTAGYNEQLVIGGLSIGDTVMAKQGELSRGRIIIDLETGQTRKLTEAGKMELKVFPNPVKDEVFVTVNYPVKYMLDNSDNINKAKVKLYSLTGERLFEYLAKPGETIRIPTSEFTQGLYFIQAEENIDKWQLDYLAPAVESVLIER